MHKNDPTEIPRSQFERAELLLDLLDETELSPLDLLDALASAGLKLVPDPEAECAGEYFSVLKSAIRADSAPFN